MLEAMAIAMCCFTLGAMVVFGSVIAPTVFQSLAPDKAGVFLRRLFPRLYLFCGVTTGLPAFFLAMAFKGEMSAVLGAVCALFFYCRGPLTSQINDARDQELAGVEGAKALFDRLHKRSVRIFGCQALVLVGVAVYV